MFNRRLKNPRLPLERVFHPDLWVQARGGPANTAEEIQKYRHNGFSFEASFDFGAPQQFRVWLDDGSWVRFHLSEDRQSVVAIEGRPEVTLDTLKVLLERGVVCQALDDHVRCNASPAHDPQAQTQRPLEASRQIAQSAPAGGGQAEALPIQSGVAAGDVLAGRLKRHCIDNQDGGQRDFAANKIPATCVTFDRASRTFAVETAVNQRTERLYTLELSGELADPVLESITTTGIRPLDDRGIAPHIDFLVSCGVLREGAAALLEPAS